MNKGNLRHGHARVGKETPTWKAWHRMIERCSSPNCSGWHKYGGRGIAVCPRWKTFEHFLADMGHKPYGKTLDRIDNNGNYEPSNCRWASLKQQARNRRSSRMVDYNGRKWVLAELAEEYGIALRTLWERIRLWGDVAKAVETPLNGHFSLTVNGVTKTKEQWAKQLGARSGYKIITSRLKQGWPLEKVVSHPLRISARQSRQAKMRKADK